MDELISALKERYETTISKIGRDFIFGISYYFDLFDHPEIQAILEYQKQLPKDHYHNFSKHYQKLLTKVYEPLTKEPEKAGLKFYGFFNLVEDDKGHPFRIITNAPSWKAYFWDRPFHIDRLTNIHGKLLVLLKNKNILPKNQVQHWFSFDLAKSILNIDGNPINIDVRKSGTNPHRILKYISEHFDKNVDGFPFSEIAENEFNDKGYLFDPNSHRRYYTACDKIKQRIFTMTQGKIDDFLEFHSGDKGSVRINPKYHNIKTT